MTEKLPEREIVRHYKLPKKEVEIQGDKYTAVFPEDHSRIKGLVYHSQEMISRGTGIRNWSVRCFIQKKDEENWGRIFHGDYDRFEINGIRCDSELGNLLFQLETEQVRQEHYQKIERLEKRIKSDTERLKDLLGN